MEKHAQQEVEQKAAVQETPASPVPLLLMITGIGAAGIFALVAVAYFAPEQASGMTIALITIMTYVVGQLISSQKSTEQVATLKNEVVELKLQVNHRMDSLLAARQEEGRQAGKRQEQGDQAIREQAAAPVVSEKNPEP